jgi:hypothetical protein
VARRCGLSSGPACHELAADEKTQIDAWLAANGKNKYGDDPGTMYAVRVGARAVRCSEVELVSRFAGLVYVHPYNPRAAPPSLLPAVVQGGNPAFNMATGVMVDRHEFIAGKFPHRPWRSGSGGATGSSAPSGGAAASGGGT